MIRERATAQIERIVGAIEADSFPVKVKELHVFGSYARGAINPNDLDLILVHDPPPDDLLERLNAEIAKMHGTDIMHLLRVGASPERRFRSMMHSVMRKPGEKMDIILATSLAQALAMGENIAKSERVLIWSSTQRAWRKKLTGIRVDETAGRFERGHFAELRRFDADLGTMDAVSTLIDEGLIALHRIDADSVIPYLNPIYQHWYDHWVNCKVMGKNSMRLLKHGLWWMQQQRGQAYVHSTPPTHDCVMVGSGFKYAVYYGKPPLYAVCRVVAKEHGYRRICLIPHFKRDQKNEMYIFRKGPDFSQKRFDAIWKRP